MKSNYSDKLRHPKWQKKRLRILERAGWKCECCDDEDSNLQIHHLIYHAQEPWGAPDNQLEALCETCHQFREDFNNLFQRSVVPTKFCWKFWSFFVDAFDGTTDIALSCSYIGELYQKLNRYYLAQKNTIPQPPHRPRFPA